MLLAPHNMAKLDNLWDRLQKLIQKENPGISQVECDELSLVTIEHYIEMNEEESQ